MTQYKAIIISIVVGGTVGLGVYGCLRGYVSLPTLKKSIGVAIDALSDISKGGKLT